MPLTGNEIFDVVGSNAAGNPSGNNFPITTQDVADLATPYSLPNSNYFFQGFAGQQRSGDPKFYDISGAGNDGTFGANLSTANAWASPGYVSTLNPVTSITDTVIRLPSFNLDYAAGESLILWWAGIGMAESSNVNAIGDGFNSTYHGVNIRVAANTGAFTLALSDASNYFGATSTGTPFLGTLSSFAVALDGNTRKYAYWVNDALDAATSTGFISYNSGTSIDTLTTNTFNIGSSLPAAAASTTGMVLNTSAFMLMKLPVGTAMPEAATLTSVFQALRRNPGKLITEAAFA